MPTPAIHDVGLRDGLQIEERTVPTDRKLQWLDRLAASGLDLIQVGSFVNPHKVPQMADTDEVFRRLRDHPARRAGVAFTGLVLNEKGLERGLACGVDYFCMGVSASDTHSRKNTGMSTAEATQRILAMGRQALGAGARVQVSVQSAFGCGFEGPVPAARVLDIARRFVDGGLTTLSLADTAGHADPAQVEDLCLGGCPFTAVAAGNVCTEDVIHLFHRLGLRPDAAVDAVVGVAKDAEAFFERPLPGVVHRTGPIPHGGRLAAPPPRA